MNRQAKMKRGQFYRHAAGALVLAVSSTRARVVSNGEMLVGLRDWEIPGEPLSFLAAALRSPYSPDALSRWRAKALELGARKSWEPMPGCGHFEESDDKKRVHKAAA